MEYSLFKKKEKTKKEFAGAPPYAEWVQSINEEKYWHVLNAHLLGINTVATDTKLNDRVNALKLCLHAYGPLASDKLPSFLHNKGKAQNHVYHGHVTSSSGTTFVLEWTVIDANKRIMAIVGFDKHENYSFKQEPLTQVEKNAILESSKNSLLMKRGEIMLDEIKEKIDRVRETYRFLV